MKNKETEFKNIKIYAHVYMNPVFGGSLYKSCFWEKLMLVSFQKSFHMQLYMLLCCFPCVTRLKSSSLHLNTLNQFKNRFTTRYTTKTAMQQRFVTCFRNVAIHIIAVSKTFHSSNHNALWFLVKRL